LEYQKERRALEKKYEELYQPAYAVREKVINNTMAPDLTAEEEEMLPKELVDAADGEDNGIEGFWLQALGQLEEIADYIAEDDVPLLLKVRQ